MQIEWVLYSTNVTVLLMNNECPSLTSSSCHCSQQCWDAYSQQEWQSPAEWCWSPQLDEREEGRWVNGEGWERENVCVWESEREREREREKQIKWGGEMTWKYTLEHVYLAIKQTSVQCFSIRSTGIDIHTHTRTHTHTHTHTYTHTRTRTHVHVAGKRTESIVLASQDQRWHKLHIRYATINVHVYTNVERELPSHQLCFNTLKTQQLCLLWCTVRVHSIQWNPSTTDALGNTSSVLIKLEEVSLVLSTCLCTQT